LKSVFDQVRQAEIGFGPEQLFNAIERLIEAVVFDFLECLAQQFVGALVRFGRGGGKEEDAGEAQGLIRETGIERLNLLPASTALATLDRQLGTREGMGLVLARALARLGERFDYALIDCAPTLGILMVNALAACEQLIVPVQTEFLAVKGLERMLRTLSMINRARPTPLPYLIVPTMFDRRTRASIETLRVLRERYGRVLWDAVIPVDTQFREASRAGMPLSLMNARARGAVAYNELADRLLGTHHATDQTRVAS